MVLLLRKSRRGTQFSCRVLTGKRWCGFSEGAQGAVLGTALAKISELGEALDEDALESSGVGLLLVADNDRGSNYCR